MVWRGFSMGGANCAFEWETRRRREEGKKLRKLTRQRETMKKKQILHEMRCDGGRRVGFVTCWPQTPPPLLLSLPPLPPTLPRLRRAAVPTRSATLTRKKKSCSLRHWLVFLFPWVRAGADILTVVAGTHAHALTHSLSLAPTHTHASP